ncbi:MAG TPA: hypothetical protein VM120_25755 [Bryobacteraceae bacterium]|nr:hypothetical protein [Bryobacteraceae bacterium]
MHIVYCHCAYARIIAPEVKNQVLDGLAGSDLEWESVPDLCEMSARHDAHLASLAAQGELRIAACYPRAVRSLFQAAGSPLSAGTRILNMRTETADQVLSGLIRGGL